MMMKKVELLAPAGNFQCFMAAIQAGADAVYLGGSQYGARAYADNFTDEEVIKAIRLAHLYKRKVYLTVNTLVKEDELSGLIFYMTPFYEAGLDGVIIQDFGVFLTLKEHFPNMELHASTQMTITGSYGAAYLKSLGACRIVPARELSLEEIREIKKEVPIEIEAFIHGAMCYAYSGQCLYSSLLGGRSGNRGRCAGPCRLPFQCDGKEEYPLSLKDMYTLPYIDQLIEAGIDSFKIEGRMKSAEYVAGVTKVYRKYIDQYYVQKSADVFEHLQVSKKDEKIVKGLYMRTGLHEGYYFKHNGKDMVTLQGGGYAGTDEAVLTEIRSQYLEQKLELPVKCKAIFHVGQNAKMLIGSENIDFDQFDGDKTSQYGDMILVEGDEVQQAQKRPLTREDILKQLQKTGDTCFKALQITIEADDDIFMPVKSLNELRRNAFEAYENMLLKDTFRDKETENLEQDEAVRKDEVVHTEENHHAFSVLLTTQEQFQASVSFCPAERIYINIDLLQNSDNLSWIKRIKRQGKETEQLEIMLALPYILRRRSYTYLKEYEQWLNAKMEDGENVFDGVLVRNLEELQWLKSISYDKQMIADANIYIFNQKTKLHFTQYFSELTVPAELNRRERKSLGLQDMEYVVYGRTPMMYTANCTKKTLAQCDGKSGFDTLTDRYRNQVPVYHNCEHCYNIIYNSVSLALHQYIGDMKKNGARSFRMEFTTENAEDMKKIMEYYDRIIHSSVPPKKKSDQVTSGVIMNPGSYTTGHYKRGVE